MAVRKRTEMRRAQVPRRRVPPVLRPTDRAVPQRPAPVLPQADPLLFPEHREMADARPHPGKRARRSVLAGTACGAGVRASWPRVLETARVAKLSPRRFRAPTAAPRPFSALDHRGC